MGSHNISPVLPHSQSPDAHLSHPTAKECLSIWKLSSMEWSDALSPPLFIEESVYLESVPLAKDGGMTQWILVDKNLAPDQRPILCSCETFRKRSLVSDTEGNVTEMVIHGVASVFCNPAYRRQGFAARMMKELARELRNWQVKSNECVGSILYSDIGKTYYANLGWRPIPNNFHIDFRPQTLSKPPEFAYLLSGDLEKLCKEDEVMVREAFARTSNGHTRS